MKKFFDSFLDCVKKLPRKDTENIKNWGDLIESENQMQLWMSHGIQLNNTNIDTIYHTGNKYSNENLNTMLTSVWLVTCLNLSREFNIKDIERVLFSNTIGKKFWSRNEKFPQTLISEIDVNENGFGLGSLVTILKYKTGGFGQYESRNIKLIHSSVAKDQKLGHFQNAHTLDELFPLDFEKNTNSFPDYYSGLIVKNKSNRQFTLTFFNKQTHDRHFLCLYAYVPPDAPNGTSCVMFLYANLEEIKEFMFGIDGDTENNPTMFNATFFKKAEDNGDEVITSMVSTHEQVYPSNTYLKA